METLHDTMMATKSVEYLVAAGFLTAFVAFWRFLTPKNRAPRNRKQTDQWQRT